MANKKFSQFIENTSLSPTGFVVGYDGINNIRVSLDSLIASLPIATSGTTGLLEYSDWITFNDKEPAIAAGTTSQYWRGDKTWQTFPTIPTVTPSALTSTDDTNVTLTLGGSPNTALLDSVSITVGWSGTLADSRIASAATWNAKLSDAPSDGTLYGRQNGNWTGIPVDKLPSGTASGTNTYTATISGISSYVDGDGVLVRFTNGNTGTSTLNINGLGAKALYRNNDGAIIGGDIWAGGQMLCVFNSTLDGFQVIGISPNALYAYVTNAESTTITKGQVVYAYGGTGDRMTVKLAYNTGDPTSAQTVGVVLSSSIDANQKGFIIISGLLDGLSILPTSTFSDGDALYLGATAGSITNVKPAAPNHLVYLGNVTTASNGAAGRWYVRVQNGYELQELHNVSLTNPPANNDGLFYETATSLWKNKSIATILGYTPASASGTTNEIAYFTAGSTLASLSTATYPSLTELSYVKGVTSAIQTQIGAKQDLSLSAYTVRANNTNATANASNQTFKSIGTQAYSGSITWGAANAPSGSTNHTYRWSQIGNCVNLHIVLVYGAAATSNQTNVTIPLPSDCPAPVDPTGVTGNGATITMGACSMAASLTTPSTVASRLHLRKNSTSTGYDIYGVAATGGLFQYVWCSITYFTS